MVLLDNDRCFTIFVFVLSESGDDDGFVSSIVVKSASEFKSVGDDDVINCACGNDDDIGCSVIVGGEVDIGTFIRCRGGLCAASRLLFGKTVRILFEFKLTESI